MHLVRVRSHYLPLASTNCTIAAIIEVSQVLTRGGLPASEAAPVVGDGKSLLSPPLTNTRYVEHSSEAGVHNFNRWVACGMADAQY